MLEQLQAVEDKYLELESLISDPDVLRDVAKWQRYNKEHAALSPVVEKFREYKQVVKSIEEDKAMFESLKLLVSRTFEKNLKLSNEELTNNRYARFRKIGAQE